MIQWVHLHCQEWARFKRKAMFGDEGWPARTTLGRLMDEGAGAAHGTFRDRSPEWLTGVALEVSRALQKMANTHEMERAWLVVHAHYLFGGRAKMKANILRVTLPSYWQQLHAAHSYLAGQIEDVEARTCVGV